MTTRIVQETVASIFQHVLVPSNPIPPSTGTFSFNPHMPIPLSMPSSTATPPAPVLLPQASLPTRSITLAGGVRIDFTADDVPRPPSISFARDVEKDFPTLNGMWDDCTEHWAGNSFLHIHGHPIPLVYWKAVYSSKQGNGWKPGEWKLIKSNYFDWKVSFSFYLNFFLVYLLIDSGLALAQGNTWRFLDWIWQRREANQVQIDPPSACRRAKGEQWTVASAGEGWVWYWFRRLILVCEEWPTPCEGQVKWCGKAVYVNEGH